MNISDQLCTRKQGEEFARLGLVPEKWEDISFVWFCWEEEERAQDWRSRKGEFLPMPLLTWGHEWEEYPGYKTEPGRIVPAYTLAEMMVLSGQIITWSPLSKFSPGSFIGHLLLESVKRSPEQIIRRLGHLKHSFIPFEMADTTNDRRGGVDPDLFTTFPDLP